MRIPNITFVVFTYNEELRLPRVIRNFAPYGRILVVDNFSADRTVEIARAGGCDVLMNKNPGWVEDYETVEKVKAAVRTDWIYWAFADEIVEAPVLEEMRRVIEEGRYRVVQIIRRNYFHGRFCDDIGATYQTRLFRKEAIDFKDNVIHKFGRIVDGDSAVYKMRPSLFIHHLMANTVASLIDSTNRYTDLEMTVGRSWNRGLPYCFLLPFKTMWGDFFVKRGYRAGRPGFSLSALLMIYSIVNTLKHFERAGRFDRERINALNEDVAAGLLREFPETAPRETVAAEGLEHISSH